LCPAEKCPPAGSFGLEGRRFAVGFFTLKMPAGCAPCFVFEPFRRPSWERPRTCVQRGELPEPQTVKGGEEGKRFTVLEMMRIVYEDE